MSDIAGVSSPDSVPNSVAAAVVALLEPILSDLGLELYDCDFAGGVLKATVDTPPGGERGVDLDQLALVTRLLGRELDHRDVVPGRYTLEVTSPGLERTLRTAAHFAREIGKPVTVRLRAPLDGRRRINGVLVAAADGTATVRADDGEITFDIAFVERARTVFEWKATPKPGKGQSRRKQAVSPDPETAQEARAS